MRPRTTRILQGPEVEPVSLEEVKTHLRIPAELEDDDAALSAMIASGRRLIEQRLGVTLLPTQYRAKWPAGAGFLELPNPPLLVGEEYGLELTAGGDAVSSTDYEIDEDAQPATLRLTKAKSGDLVATYWAGSATVDAVEPQLRSALLMYVGHLYANREASSMDAPVEVPLAFEALLASASIAGRW